MEAQNKNLFVWVDLAFQCDLETLVGQKRKTSADLRLCYQSECNEPVSLATSFDQTLQVNALSRTHVLSKHEAGTGF